MRRGWRNYIPFIAIIMLLSVLITTAGCEGYTFPAPEQPAPEPEKPVSTTFINSEDKATLAVYEHLLSQAEKVTRTGLPMLRALVFHHPGDRLCWHIDDQYYFGDDFLVAPVMNSRNRRDVYLPEGNWINLFSGENQPGNQWLKNVDIPLAEMPVWVKKGAEVPVYPEKISSTDEYDPSKTKIIKFDSSFKGLDRSCLGELLTDQITDEG